MLFSKWFKPRQPKLTMREVVESLSLFSGRLDDFEATQTTQQQALWRVEKRVNKYLGRDNGDQAQEEVGIQPVLEPGQPTTQINW